MPREGEQVSVRLTGGGPYGFRICATGDGPRHQLIVAKLHKKSKARAAGVRVGDVVLSINGSRCQRMSQETANNIIDNSNDLNIQLIRSADNELSHPILTSSFRHSPQPLSSLSPSSAPYHSESESATLERSTTPELFRPEASHRRHPLEPSFPQRRGQSGTPGEPPTVKVTGCWNKDAPHQRPLKSVRWSGTELEPGRADAAPGPEVEAGRWQTDGKDGGEDGFEWRKWRPPASAEMDAFGDITEHGDSSPQKPMKPSSNVAQFQTLPSFHPTQALPSKPKPSRWKPPSAVDQNDSCELSGVESATLSQSAITRPLDSLVHEVVIWSSKQTEIEQVDGADQTPLPWQQPRPPGGKTHASLNEDLTSSLAGRQKPSQWQPHQQKSEHLEGQEFIDALKLPTWQPSQSTAAMATERTPTWQPSQPGVTIATEKTPIWQPTPTEPVDASTSERSQRRQQRWQPTQPSPAPPHGSQYIQTDQPASQPNTLAVAEPKRSPQDGSTSPVVTTLFLTRVVTDGSTLVAGSGNDAETTLETVTTGKRKLYGDSSFYEDPEHIYPTIEEQIKMARKVALLLTSPVNKNARGQRMFLKRKELSSKWVIDTSNDTLPYLFVSPPKPHPLHSSPEEKDHSTILSPGEVERMRLYEEKSHHDVIPFDVCSMLAAELHEEKGRGGRLFAKRREKADMSITPESNGLIRVPSPRPQQKPKFVPEAVTPSSAPIFRAERDDGAQPSVSVPINRLKDMVDLPKSRITPWDSAVQYGTVEPAFEHLKNYRPHTVEPTPTVAGPPGSLDHGGGLQGTFRQGHVQGQGQGRTSNQSFGLKVDELVEDRRTVQYQSNYSEPQKKVAGVDGFDGSSGFIRQASAKPKGYRQVHFEAGPRSFN